jgi:arginyl-tRNA synthetase
VPKLLFTASKPTTFTFATYLAIYMSIVIKIKQATQVALQNLYGVAIDTQDILVNVTKPEFEGNYTVVTFGFTKHIKKNPEQLGSEIGSYLIANFANIFDSFNVIKGFLNIEISNNFLLQFLQKNSNNIEFGLEQSNGKKVMIEYSSPNTNKPLHLGHLRNNFLGLSIANILQASGYTVYKTCIVNDRGIHICKSMVAWQHFGNNQTPQTTNTKGDHFVGDYYVKFNDEYKLQIAQLVANGLTPEVAEKQAPIFLEAQQMLVDWEAAKPSVIDLWQKMNSWVYAGFDVTYKNIGTSFDKVYYESNTYLLGKKIVEEGLSKNVFYKKDDGSVWINLIAEGLDEKVVMRKDGTSVYITQDIGLAQQKQEEFAVDKSIYVVGDEQNYHFKVLKLICQKLELLNANGIYHLSYGMVELPTGKMKSREGTVVDADDLLQEMIEVAKEKTTQLGKVQNFLPAQLQELYTTIGLGALKFFLLRVDPKKKMIFNPEESIDINGFTATFIQYTHARIKSVLRKLNDTPANNMAIECNNQLLPLEKEMLVLLDQFCGTIHEAANDYNPSAIAIYVFTVAKTFNSFYNEHSVANAENETKQILRLNICKLTAQVIKTAMGLLVIEVPEQM